jgi:hypothetical protein
MSRLFFCFLHRLPTAIVSTPVISPTISKSITEHHVKLL